VDCLLFKTLVNLPVLSGVILIFEGGKDVESLPQWHSKIFFKYITDSTFHSTFAHF
jgi:hypothetical protein